MAITFPTTLDSLLNPNSTDSMNVVSHSAQHANANDAIEALEAKVGVDNSAVTTSLDYLLKSSSSINPGHKHTSAAITDLATSTITFSNKVINGASNTLTVRIADISATGTPSSTTYLRGDGTWSTPAGGGGGTWGSITGTLSSQTDLQTALNAKANLSGATFTGSISATNLSGTNTGDQTITLTGDATGSGTGSFAVTVSNAAVIAKVLTGFSATTGTVTSADTLLSAIQKLAGNQAVPFTKRVTTLTDAATVTPNCGTTDAGTLATLSQATTIANPTGTPVSFQEIVLRIKSSAAQALTWGSQYRGSADLPLPTATSGSSLTDYFKFVWNSADSKWDYIAKNQGF